MTKGQKQKKRERKDFIAAKKKIGKRNIPQNETRPDVRVKAIKLIEQKALSRATSTVECVTSKKLTLRELVAQTNHYNHRTRREALQGIVELLTKYSVELQPHLSYLLFSISKCVTDQDDAVRAQYRVVLEKVLTLLNKQTSSDSGAKNHDASSTSTSGKLSPFKEQLGLQLRSCMSHRNPVIRNEALSYIELLLSSGAVHLVFLRQIIISSASQYNDTTALDVNGQDYHFLLLVEFVSNLYERCCHQTLDLSRYVDSYAVTRISMMLLGVGSPEDNVGLKPELSKMLFRMSAVKLNSWVESDKPQEELLEKLPNAMLSYSSTIQRYLAIILSILEAVKHTSINTETCASKGPMRKNRIFLFVSSSIKKTINLFKDTTPTDVSSAPHVPQSTEDVYFYLPWVLRRDLCYLLTQILKYVNRRLVKTLDNNIEADPHTHMSTTLQRHSDPDVMKKNKKNVAKRVISSVFLDIGIADAPSLLSDVQKRPVCAGLHQHLQLIVMEALPWFLDEFFSSVAFNINLAFICVVLLLYNTVTLSSSIPRICWHAGTVRQLMSCLCVYTHLVPSQLCRPNTLLFVFLNKISGVYNKNPSGYHHSAEHALSYIVAKCHRQPNAEGITGSFTILREDHSEWGNTNTSPSKRSTIEYEHINDEILTGFVHYSHSPWQFVQQKTVLLFGGIWDQLIKVNVDALGEMPLNDLCFMSQPADTVHCVQPSKNGTRLFKSEPGPRNSALRVLLCALLILCSSLNFSLEVQPNMDSLWNVPLVQWSLEMLKDFKKYKTSLSTEFVRPLRYSILSSFQIRKWILEWMKVACAMSGDTCVSNAFFSLFLILVKSFSEFLKQPIVTQQDRDNLNGLCKSICAELKQSLFDTPPKGNRPHFTLLNSEAQLTVLYIWNTVRCVMEDHESSRAEFIDTWSSLLNNPCKDAISDHVTTVVQDTLCFYSVDAIEC